MIARLLVSLAVLCGAGGVAIGAADPAAAAGACTASTGVVVAVDFGHWSGPIVRGCAATPTTGVDALQQAGFSPAGTQPYGLAFVCRIASGSFRGGAALPSKADQSCMRTPPASAYWSYWHSDRGQSGWSYSSLGAASYAPKPGSVDAWAFGAGNPPSTAPSALRASGGAPASASAPSPAHSSSAHRTASPTQPGTPAGTSAPAKHRSSVPRSTTAVSAGASNDSSQPGPSRSAASETASSATSASTGSKTAAGTSTAPTTNATAGSPPSTAAPATATPTATTPTATASSGATVAASGAAATTASTSAADISASPTVVDAVPAATSHRSGSALPAVLGGLLVVLLAAGAALTMWRRRQTG